MQNTGKRRTRMRPSGVALAGVLHQYGHTPFQNSGDFVTHPGNGITMPPMLKVLTRVSRIASTWKLSGNVR